MAFIPSSYQQAIFDWFRSGSRNAAVNAVAGSGKTTSIVEGLNRIPSDFHNPVNALFAAFNKAIVEELTRRLPGGVQCQTIHSLGFATLRKSMSYVAKWDIDDAKYKLMARRLDVDRSYGDPKVFKDAALDLLRFAQATLCPIDSESLADLADRFSIEIPPCGIEPLANAVSLFLQDGIRIAEEQGKISFGDMLWLPAYQDMQPQTFRMVCIDEAQDLSKAQMTLIQRAANGDGRVVACGDPRQAIYCQPAGTRVLTVDGERLIENLKVGDTVVAWNRRDYSFYKNAIISKAGSRPISEHLFKVSIKHSEMPELAKAETECTDNHRWIVRWSDRSFEHNVTYLMRKGNRFRVGWCQLFSKTDGDYGCFHLGQRTRIETADAAWILGVYPDKTSASIAESEIAMRFGLPTIPFRAVNGAQHLTQEAIDRFFDSISDVDIQDRVGKCLSAFNRRSLWPFYEVDSEKRGRTTLFEVRACNLISGMMKVPIWSNDRHKTDWLEIKVSSRMAYEMVYSLEVDRHHTYVANGIVTGNSFAGAESDSFHQLINHFNAEQLPLSICYRCPTSVIQRAQQIVPQIEAAPDAPAGIADTIKYDKFREMLRSGDMILCRTTAPLIKLCFELIAQKRHARIKGRDIAGQLANSVKQICSRRDFSEFPKLLQTYREKQLDILQAKVGTEGQQEALNDKCDALEVCFQTFAPVSVEGFIQDIEGLFSDQRAAITLSTVHRSKGLENPRVFIICPEKLPLIWKGQTPEQNIQEWNLKYVAITRAQQELYFVESVIQEKL